MTGQDAIKSAGEFNRRVGVTGVVLTSSMATRAAALPCRWSRSSACRSRSPAAASGWRTSRPFHPDRVVSRLLGMGDVLSAHREGRGGHRRRGRREARAEAPQERVHARGLPRPAADDSQDGAARRCRDDPGDGQHLSNWPRTSRTRSSGPRRGHHRLDDARSGAQPRSSTGAGGSASPGAAARRSRR